MADHQYISSKSIALWILKGKIEAQEKMPKGSKKVAAKKPIADQPQKSADSEPSKVAVENEIASNFNEYAKTSGKETTVAVAPAPATPIRKRGGAKSTAPATAAVAIVTPEHTNPRRSTKAISSSVSSSQQSSSVVHINVITPTKDTTASATGLASPISSIKKEFARIPQSDDTVAEAEAVETDARGEKSPFKSRLAVGKNVDRVYKLVRKATGQLGGNGHTGAIYGELTMASMHRVLEVLVTDCELGPDSRIIDVGCGLGKPNFHMAQYPGVRLSIGVELEELRWKV